MSAWGFCMRLSEFADKKSYCRELMLNYNLKSACIRIADTGFSAAFESDKTSTRGDPVKHHTVLWEHLLAGAKTIIEDYAAIRPDSTWFFCKNDSRALTRNDVLNLLDWCLLQTEWRFLRITPHSFRQGRPSQEPLEGANIDDLMHAGRWTKKSTAFDHYSHTDLALLPPQKIYNTMPKCRRVFTTAKLQYLSNNIIQVAGQSHAPPPPGTQEVLLGAFGGNRGKYSRVLPQQAVQDKRLDGTHRSQKQNIPLRASTATANHRPRVPKKVSSSKSHQTNEHKRC